MKGTIFAILFIIPVALGGYPSITPTTGRPWPLPTNEVQNSGFLNVTGANFIFTSVGNDCDILQKAFARYRFILFDDKVKEKNNEENELTLANDELASLDVNVLNPCEDYPHLDMDESYQLDICSPSNPDGASLVSSSIWGALRGLETFSQYLITIGIDDYYVLCTQTFDFPRFSHRGILLDTSRHYLPLSIIKENLDVMAMNKFNVFHWHIVDDQSFPYVSDYNPMLSELGSYSPEMVYYHPDISEVVDYARDRGIRVVVEFDTPGHTLSWGPGQPGLLTACYSNGEPDGSYGPIDPSKADNFAFLYEHFQEVSSKFPDHYIHLGGDEVPFGCWQSNPDITDFMSNMGIDGDYKALEQYYFTTLIETLNNLTNNNGYIVWEEVFNNGIVVPNDTVIHVWVSDNTELGRITAAGYQALFSNCWYLNYISYGSDWQNYYNCDPQDFDGTTEQKNLVMGGEACMWAEYVDKTNLISRMWPRASAVAERLWSNKDDTQNAGDAATRLEEHRCRMLGRGIAAEPVNGPSFCEGIV